MSPACLGASVSTKRVALSHVLFNHNRNNNGANIFVLFYGFIAGVQSNFNLAPKLTIAFAHATFNAVNTILLFPFISQLCIYELQYTFKWEERENMYKPQYINDVLLYTAPRCGNIKCKKKQL